MKTIIGVYGISVLVVLTGCTREQDKDEGDDIAHAPVAIETRMDDAVERMKEGWDAVADYSSDKAGEFVDYLSVAGEKMRSRADTLAERSGDTTTAASERFNQAWDVFHEQLAAAGEATEEAWEEAKQNVELAWYNLKDAYDDLAE